MGKGEKGEKEGEQEDENEEEKENEEGTGEKSHLPLPIGSCLTAPCPQLFWKLKIMTMNFHRKRREKGGAEQG